MPARSEPEAIHQMLEYAQEAVGMLAARSKEDLRVDYLRDLALQQLISMIGCGHFEAGAWRFASFSVEALTQEAEAAVIDAWFSHMCETTARLWPGGTPRIYHWSPAETSVFEKAYNSARVRHPDRKWPEPNWFDFMSRVMREEPVAVRGAFGFGLKGVARALHKHGLIEATWEDSSVDGLGAMVGTWWHQTRDADEP